MKLETHLVFLCVCAILRLEHICLDCKMYISKLSNVFTVQIAKCIWCFVCVRNTPP